jgi:hypothetical protein
LETANGEALRSNRGLAQRGQAGRLLVFTTRERKLNNTWQSLQ